MSKERQGIFRQDKKPVANSKGYRGARRDVGRKIRQNECCDVVAAGCDSVGVGATVDVCTITRKDDVLLYAYVFADTQKAAAYNVAESAAAPAGRNVHWRFVKTTTLDQVTLQVQNGNEAVVVDWKIRRCC